MSDAVVIKEFLVALGFKTDEKSLKNFTQGVEDAGKSVLKLVAAVETAALAVGAGVAAFAANMEQLYFASQRTGASIGNLKALDYAARQLGASSQEARSAIEGLARFMRDTPGSESFLKSLGIDARDANGGLRDTSEVMLDVGRKLATMPWYQAKAYAGVLGIDDNMLRAIQNGDFEKFADDYRRMTKDIDFQKTEADAHKFMGTIRVLETHLEAFALKVTEALASRLGNDLAHLSEWFEKNGPAIADRTAEIAVALAVLAETLGSAIMWVVDHLIEMDKATDGVSTKVLAATAIFAALGGPAVVAGILRLVSAMTALGAATNAAAGGAAAAAGTGAASRLGWLGRLAGGLGLMLYSSDLNEGEDAWAAEKRRRYNKTGRPEAEELTRLERKYGLPAGLLDSVWNAESGRGQHMLSPAGAEGPFQFMPSTAKQYGLANPYDFAQSADAAARYYRDLLGRYGGSLEKAAAAYNWGPGNVDRYGLGGMPWETRGYVGKVLGGMGSGGVQIAQTTTIHVSGASDPAATGRAVAGEQNRVNADITRNVQLAMQ